MGELVSCPFCLGQWVATALVMGRAVVPVLTAVVDVLALARTGDCLQLLCGGVRNWQES